jgi:predicted DsbA family dithiol-disulfide isomerase
LIVLGDEIGLSGKAVKQMLDSDELADEVRYDERQARELGINGVPFFVINDRYGVSGAQQPEVFLQTLEKAWQEYEKENREVVTVTDDTAVCSPGSNC